MKGSIKVNLRPCWRTSGARGFGLVELLVALVLLTLALSFFHTMVFGGARAFARSRARLDLMASCRASLRWIRNDVRRATSSVKVSDGGDELRLKVLDSSAADLPQRDGAGGFVESEVVYRYEPATKRVYRNGTVIGQEIPDMEFRQQVHQLGKVSYVSVVAQATAVIDGRPIGVRISAVPRMMSGWAGSPAWIFSTLDAPYAFEVDQ